MNELPQIDVGKPTETPQSADFTAADQIDLLCDAFESAWLRGESPQIEAYLEPCDESGRGSLLAELLLLDRELRIRRGETASRLEYQRRFPQYATVIDRLDFATIDERDRRRSGAVDRSAVPLPGTKLAHFELLNELGSGASGTVWKAQDLRLRRTVAIKIPRQGSLTDDERKRFLREGQACAQLQHPNIVAVYEVGEDRGQVFIVAEFIEGVNLRDWLKRRRPNPNEAAELAAQLAEALHHAHHQGVIHRDLKPANVLLDNIGRPYITDFGLAKWTADTTAMTVEGHILGTPAYMSPEQARGDAAQVDRTSDVYGLGALLYEMISGQPPFVGDVATIIHQVIHDEPRALRRHASSVPRDLETVCLKAMEKDACRRYPSAQEMAVDLRRYLCGEPIFARRLGVSQRTWRWIRRRPAAAASFMLVVFLAVAGMAISSLQQTNYRLQGYRPVRIETTPTAATIAIVRIDKRTGEPSSNSDDVVRPRGHTPLQTLLKPGEYLVEAVVVGERGSLDFVEEYRTVSPAGMLSDEQMQSNQDLGDDADLLTFDIRIPTTGGVIADMIRVQMDKDTRNKNSLVPEFLYVDVHETPYDGTHTIDRDSTDLGSIETSSAHGISFDRAKQWANSRGKRLASAVEYDAIMKAINERHLLFVASGRPLKIEDLTAGRAEWTTTKYGPQGEGQQAAIAELQSMHVLKGFGDPGELPGLLWNRDGCLLAAPELNSTQIGFRGVRSGAPRFVKP